MRLWVRTVWLNNMLSDPSEMYKEFSEINGKDSKIKSWK